MSILSVIEGNPRGRRRKSSRRRKSTSHAKARTPKRRRRRHTNPVHAKRRTHRRRRHTNPRRHARRHRNPAFGGAIVGDLMKGGTAFLAFLAADGAAKAVNHFGFNDTLAGPTKIGLKAGVGIAGYFAIAKLAKQPSLAKFFLLGAGFAVAQEVYDQFVKATVHTAAPWLADYGYGNLQGWAPQQMGAYGTGQLQGWAPQGVLAGDDGAYGGGAY